MEKWLTDLRLEGWRWQGLSCPLALEGLQDLLSWMQGREAKGLWLTEGDCF